MAGFLVPRRSAVVRWRGTLEGLIPEQHLVRFVWQVLSSLDFAELEGRYQSVREGPGRPPYHPRVLAALWIYGMTQGMETAADIAMGCEIRDDFRWLAGGLCPSDQTLLNFLTHPASGLGSIWEQLLKAMHEEGHIDLSAIAEDGTKLRANTSPRSFRTAPEIGTLMEGLRTRIATKLEQLASGGETGQALAGKARAQLRTLQGQLSRAERAVRELDERQQRREGRAGQSSGGAVTRSVTSHEETIPATSPNAEAPSTVTPFGRQDFRHEPERNVVVCPAEQELRFIGQYSTDNGRGAYRLYGRRDCSGCPQKVRCTNGKGRRIKLLVEAEDPPRPPDASSSSCSVTQAKTGGEEADVGGTVQPRGPVASITEPEALMMLATSEKRWEPSYNADLAVTRHGIIVSQFLTKHPTDFHHFEPALQAVVAALGKPQSWIGDGHYGTHANLLLADREGVVLYAPPAGSSDGRNSSAPRATTEQAAGAADSPHPSPPASPVPMESPSFDRHSFRLEPDRDVMVCPAGQDLRLIGVYATDNAVGAYRLYGRSDCGDCTLKAQCTDGKGRRLRMPTVPGDPVAPPKSDECTSGSRQDLGFLLQALEMRMRQVGDAVRKFRGQTVEPVNAQLKQHGVGRFHVHGLPRCAAILTLACMGHNLTKWRAREAARSMRAIAS